MRRSTSTINRCQAVATHGRRCRQTPFMTSPFCWHHTAAADRDALRRQSLRGDDQAKELVDRIVNANLTEEQVERIERALAARS
jgi:hypothetical protein